MAPCGSQPKPHAQRDDGSFAHQQVLDAQVHRDRVARRGDLRWLPVEEVDRALDARDPVHHRVRPVVRGRAGGERPSGRAGAGPRRSRSSAAGGSARRRCRPGGPASATSRPVRACCSPTRTARGGRGPRSTTDRRAAVRPSGCGRGCGPGEMALKKPVGSPVPGCSINATRSFQSPRQKLKLAPTDSRPVTFTELAMESRLMSPCRRSLRSMCVGGSDGSASDTRSVAPADLGGELVEPLPAGLQRHGGAAHLEGQGGAGEVDGPAGAARAVRRVREPLVERAQRRVLETPVGHAVDQRELGLAQLGQAGRVPGGGRPVVRDGDERVGPCRPRARRSRRG